MSREEIMKKRSEVINNLANLEKRWEVLQEMSGQKFPLNWKKLSIKKMVSIQPQLRSIVNKSKELLFNQLNDLNAQLDESELKQMIKDRYDTYLSKEENLIKDGKIEFAVGTDGKINGEVVPLDTLLKARELNRKKLSELNNSLRERQVELELEALNLLKSL